MREGPHQSLLFPVGRDSWTECGSQVGSSHPAGPTPAHSVGQAFGASEATGLEKQLSQTGQVSSLEAPIPESRDYGQQCLLSTHCATWPCIGAAVGTEGDAQLDWCGGEEWGAT